MPFDIGNRVIVNLEGLETQQLPDRGDQIEATGTVVGKPGGLVYDVHLDEPIGASQDLLYLREERLRLVG